ncbi:unnamed protein product [Adineta steineri]|uniref:Peptidase S1 domain-containing protein n=1 Tax=Adineta steineri TaxID=433720 RepID=A0A814MW46_9BILA|nr:unnamed protein product [Adineta steineri]
MLFLLVLSVLLYNSFIQAIPSVSFYYPKNLTESTCTNDHSWTKWFNSAKPNSTTDFDQEVLSIIQAQNGRNICAIPQGIQAGTVTALNINVSYEAAWKTANGIITAFVSRTAGVDFQVRFCCANNNFITTTPPPPRPVTNGLCGRAKIKPLIQFTRIFGGSRAIPHSWPWQVLYEEEKLCETDKICIDTCGGTLIDSYHVLTAAHCIKRHDLQHIFITAGVHNRQSDELDTRQERNVNSIVIHPDWNRESLVNDLAILRLDKPVKFNDYVQPACLPGPDPLSKSNVMLIGWGAEQMGGNTYNELKQAQVKVIGECQQYWNQYDEDNQICVGQTISGDSACQGDSGGPLLQQYKDQWVLQGVASFIDDCKTNGNSLPNVYVKVSAYLTWINSIIN